jgi:hypothetical protein
MSEVRCERIASGVIDEKVAVEPREIVESGRARYPREPRRGKTAAGARVEEMPAGIFAHGPACSDLGRRDVARTIMSKTTRLS